MTSNNNLNNLTHNYIFNTENFQANFDLATEYDRLGHFAPAVSYYLRAAEVADDNNLAYAALCKVASCYDRSSRRKCSVTSTLQQAIALMPNRPEGYYLLSKYYERTRDFTDGYYLLTIATKLCDFDLEPLIIDTGYYGKFQILYEKSQNAWNTGKSDDARKTLQDLVDDHWHELNEEYQENVKKHLGSNVGWGPEKLSHRTYYQEFYNKLKFKFPGVENIKQNYSQVYQDLFVLYMLQGKKNGKFLEIGGAQPFKGNNTALLESGFGWSGVAVEWFEEYVNEYRAARPNINVYHLDARYLDYEKIMPWHFDKEVIDYLQLDIEPSNSTYDVLLKIPFHKYKFAVITYEHDHYSDHHRLYREKSREYLREKGYELVVGNVSPIKNIPFEDWWVHPDLVDRALIDQIKKDNYSEVVIDDHLFDTGKDRSLPMINVKSDPLLVNPKAMKGLWVVDNFYQDPMSIRKFALEQEYHQGGFGRGYIGRRTFKQFLFPGLKEAFEKIMGQKIIEWESHGMNGRFQYNSEGEPLVYHVDSQKWAGMLYLTPDAPYETGTRTLAKKGTDIRHLSHPDIMTCFRPGSQNLDKTIYEDVDIIGNVFNRLVIFNAGYLHAASGYFGWTPENCRLWQMFFFD